MPITKAAAPKKLCKNLNHTGRRMLFKDCPLAAAMPKNTEIITRMKEAKPKIENEDNFCV